MERESDFEAFFKANERRIHYQIRRLGIPGNLYGEFYSEGIFALWRAYKRYDPEKGELGTFTNYTIRYRLLDLIRKKVRDREMDDRMFREGRVHVDDGNRVGVQGLGLGIPIVHGGICLKNEAFWREVRKELTPKQWKWVHYFIIADLTVKEIMEIEEVSADAVKGWGREVRRKLGNERVRKRLVRLL